MFETCTDFYSFLRSNNDVFKEKSVKDNYHNLVILLMNKEMLSENVCLLTSTMINNNNNLKKTLIAKIL